MRAASFAEELKNYGGNIPGAVYRRMARNWAKRGDRWAIEAVAARKTRRLAALLPKMAAVRAADDAKLAAGCAVTCDGDYHSPWCPTAK